MTKVAVFWGLAVSVIAILIVLNIHKQSALRADLAAARATKPQATASGLRPMPESVGVREPEQPLDSELAAAREEVAKLKNRPKGVVDSAFHSPMQAGQATPAAAAETFILAVSKGNVEDVSHFIKFRDDSPATREAFMAQFSPAVRNRYDTPEKLCAAALYALDYHRMNPDLNLQMQIASVVGNGGAERSKVTVWLKTGTGIEAPQTDSFELHADGWSLKPLSLANPALLEAVEERLDPATGNLVVRQKP